MRLWDALERGLLCPFQYFGLHDNTDLSSVRWSRKGYDTAELERLYTGDDARVRLVLEQVQQKHRDVGTMRALGFCVSIAHAEFMARRFTEAGLPSVAVSADTDSDKRKDALASLRAGRVRALFAVDLFNEGVDLPEVDTLLFLRPTESALVFLQQLGRGLRRHEGKDCVTGTGLHRPVASAIPLRPALSRGHGDHANRSRETGAARFSVPACGLLDAVG